MKRASNYRPYLEAAAAVLVLLVPVAVQNLYLIHMANGIGITVIVALGLNLLTGYAGQISIGHAAFFAMGAYTTAILMTKMKASFWAALPASALVASTFGVVVGRPTLKLKGAYLAMATIGIGEITQLVLLNWTKVTSGAMGIKGIPAPRIGGLEIVSEAQFFYLIFAVMILMFWITDRILGSEIGRALIAVRENETAAEVMGIDVARLKLLAFTVSTCFAGIAGSLVTVWVGYVSPYGFGFKESVAFLCMVLAGGMGYRFGPVIGVVVLALGREVFRVFNDYQLVVYGLLLVLVIVFMPKGIAGALVSVWKRSRTEDG